MFDKLIEGALQGMGQQQGGTNVMQLLAGLLAGSGGAGGGLAGLIQQFQQAGLGQHMDSWISTGQNMPINLDQLMQVFGQGGMQQMADSAGMDVQDLGQQMSQMLPQVIDRLTPEGAVPSGGLDDALGQLSRLMPR